MIIPDTKDWTWVLDRPCPECGFAAAETRATDVAALLRANADGWAAVLAGGSAEDIRRRPRPDTWSPLEYACHVRDVFRIYDERLHLMIREEAPLFPNWDQDATAVAERYHEQGPAQVSTELTAAARTLADSFDAVGPEQWSRTGARSDGAHFTIDTFARYFIHDPVHHLHDVTGRA